MRSSVAPHTHAANHRGAEIPEGDDARILIDNRLAEIREEAAELERALPHLGDRTPLSRRRRKAGSADSIEPTRRGRRSPKRRPTPKRDAGTRAPRGRRREELLAASRASPGSRPSELAETIGIRPTQVSVLIAMARGDGLIVKSGGCRSTGATSGLGSERAASGFQGA